MKDRVEAYARRFHAEHEELYTNLIPDADAGEWMAKNIPHFACSDGEIEETYYFRWWTFRKHIRQTPAGCVITEFLPDVPWSGEHNLIVCPAWHHITEGRWLRDSSVLQSDIRILLSEKPFQNSIRYSSALLYGIYQFCRAIGAGDFAREMLPDMERMYADWEKNQMTKYGLFWSEDNRDGMEFSISGNGLRPTLNAYLYGAALALADLCKLSGNGREALYREKAEALRSSIQRYLWDGKAGFFKTVPMDTVDGVADFARTDKNRDVREEIGYIPFAFPGLYRKEQTAAFALLGDPAVFSAPYGITTADQSHPLFMKNPVRHECLWDGPVWPYATSQTLTSLYSLLGRGEIDCVSPKEYMKLLAQYAKSQKLEQKGKTVNWIDEDLDPYTGQWIARDLIYLDHAYAGKFPKERGADYNHSTFCDLVLSGACGIVPSFDLESGRGHLDVQPLSCETWSYFQVENLSLGGETYALYYDRDQTRFGFPAPLTLTRGGKIVASGDRALHFDF